MLFVKKEMLNKSIYIWKLYIGYIWDDTVLRFCVFYRLRGVEYSLHYLMKGSTLMYSRERTCSWHLCDL